MSAAQLLNTKAESRARELTVSFRMQLRLMELDEPGDGM